MSMPHFRDLCSNEVHTGLYLVRAKSLKERMEAAAGNTARKLLDQIQSMARDSNDHVCSTYASMATVVSLVSLSMAEHCWNKFISCDSSDLENACVTTESQPTP